MASKVVKAGKSVMLGSFVAKGISLAGSLALARLLFADDYGSLVIAMVFAGFISQISDMGFEIYFLHLKGSPNQKLEVLEQVFNLRVLTNGIMSVLQVLAGLYLYYFTSNKTSAGIILLMSVSLFTEGFCTPREAILKDELDFTKITIAGIIKETVATIARIAAAFGGLGGLAFGFGPMIGSLSKWIYLKRIVGYRHAGFIFKKDIIKPVFNFSKHVLFSSAGMYVVQQLDRIFLSIYFPKTVVGYYGFAWSNATIPFNYFISPQQQVILTYITRYTRNSPILFEKLMTVVRLILLMFFPLNIIALLFTKELVIFFVTDKWLEAIPFIKIVLVYYFALGLLLPFSPMLTALGLAKTNATLTLTKAIVLILGLAGVIYLFPGNVMKYLIVFVSISLAFDISKAYLGIRHTATTISKIVTGSLVEIFCFALIVLIYALNYQDQLSLNYRLGLLLVVLIVFTAMLILFRKQRTFEAFKIIYSPK